MSLDQFPSSKASTEEWVRWCEGKLEEFESETAHDPLANGVRSLAYLLARGVDADEAPLGALHAVAKNLCDNALFERADHFAATHLPTDDAIISSIHAALDNADFETFEAFKESIEQPCAGVVFTAHPTFASPRAMRNAFADYATAQNDTDKGKAKAAIAALDHLPDDPLTLYDEHRDSQIAIAHAQDALRFLNKTILNWSHQKFGKDRKSAAPNPISLATWVGYDLDGRNDIHWGETFRLRLEEKALQLSRYATRLEEIAGDGDEAKPIITRLQDASTFASEQAKNFTGDLDDPDVVVRAANTLTADDPRRITSLKDISAAVQSIIDKTPDKTIRSAYCSLRSEMVAYGLSVARIHLRVNAAQVRSTLRADLGLEKSRAFLNRTILSTAAERSANVDQRQVNMASVFSEKMTARRQFMMCAQFKKHVDADTPIRFLIAECEAPATVMGAVFLARLYGVDDIVDISPLFETAEAIERGGRFMERLLDEPEFVDYIRKRGRVAIQLGFSDSGRFMGQIAADLAIERLHILLARALADRDIREVEVVLFNTHGESMGRGAFPGSFKERFDHLLTPWTRSRYDRDGLRINAESSFQGGDGFLHFQTPSLARSTIAQLFAWAITKPQVEKDDKFYTDINFSWDFYRGVKAWQEALFENTDYHIALSAFAPDLLVKTGSRRVRRQNKDPSTAASPRSMRAIPNNAILQQLCAPMNVCGGIGAASGREAERFQNWATHSSRVDGIAKYALTARNLSDLGILRAYASLYDASLWSARNVEGFDGSEHPYAIIAGRLSDQKVHTALARLANHFGSDIHDFDRLFSELSKTETINADQHISLRLLHAIRIALIMEAFRLTASVPSFSRRHDVSYGALIDLVLKLDFDGLTNLLIEIFPVAKESTGALSGITELADDNGNLSKGYPEIHRNMIHPLQEIAKIIDEIGVGISHHYNAYG